MAEPKFKHGDQVWICRRDMPQAYTKETTCLWNVRGTVKAVFHGFNSYNVEFMNQGGYCTCLFSERYIFDKPQPYTEA